MTAGDCYPAEGPPFVCGTSIARISGTISYRDESAGRRGEIDRAFCIHDGRSTLIDGRRAVERPFFGAVLLHSMGPATASREVDGSVRVDDRRVESWHRKLFEPQLLGAVRP